MSCGDCYEDDIDCRGALINDVLCSAFAHIRLKCAKTCAAGPIVKPIPGVVLPTPPVVPAVPAVPPVPAGPVAPAVPANPAVPAAPAVPVTPVNINIARAAPAHVVTELSNTAHAIPVKPSAPKADTKKKHPPTKVKKSKKVKKP